MKNAKHQKQPQQKNLDTSDSNPDAITNKPGSQVVGTSAGSASGALAGGAIGGAVGGPLGAVVGAGIGAVAGGLGGKALGEVVNPTEEDEYWRQNFHSRPYYKEGSPYESYEAAYRYGWESAARPEYQGKQFGDVEEQLAREWPSFSNSKEEFAEYRPAAQDAYDRVFHRIHKTEQGVATRSNNAWRRVEQNWVEFKEKIKERWSRLTDQDIDEIHGERNRFVHKVHERYGSENWKEQDIDREIDEIASREPVNKT